MGYVTIGFASLVTQGSSSGVVTLAVMLFVLFGMSVKDGRKMECFWQEMTLLSVACLISNGKSDGYPDVFRNECDYDDRVSSGAVAGTYQQ